MGQEDILNALSETEWRTAKEIAKQTNVGISSTSRNINILIRSGDIICKQKKEVFIGTNPYPYKKVVG